MLDIETDEAFRVLLTDLDDEDRNVRWSAVLNLGLCGRRAASALLHLEEALSDVAGSVGAAATLAIVRIEGQ